MTQECIFCGIVNGTVPAHIIWEDVEHLAFLSIFPNTEGFSVVIPKAHHPSYVFSVEDKVVTNLILASKKVAKLLDRAFDDVGRTGMVFEGFGVDHLHAKLIPMHGTHDEEWRQRRSSVDKYFTHYEGYLSSHDYQRADDKVLANLAEHIRAQ